MLFSRSVAFGSAECDDRQGQIGLDVTAATSVASHGGFDPGSLLRVAAQGNVTGGRKLARHDFYVAIYR
jgi:hypothetical protein